MNEEVVDNFSPEDYYSLLDLLDKLGKEGVAELVTKGKPRRVTQGDMIYFLKKDVERVLGAEVFETQESFGLIVDDELDDVVDLTTQLKFEQIITKRMKVGQDEDVYKSLLDMSGEILYGRSKGDVHLQKLFSKCGIISSLHGKMYLDEDNNLLYENVGANKSKIRGCKDKTYTVLEAEDIGVLVEKEIFDDVLAHSNPITVSIKLGYQLKPHFIIRVRISKK